MPEIVLDNLCKSFDGVVAANGLSLTIADGEYVCILGPTGAGKTTCMRMVCGLTHPDSGKVFFDGRDVTEDSVDSRNATMLSQTYALFPQVATEFFKYRQAQKTKVDPTVADGETGAPSMSKISELKFISLAADVLTAGFPDASTTNWEG